MDNLEQKLSSRMEVYFKTIYDRLREMKKMEEITMTNYLLQKQSLADNLIGPGSQIMEQEIENWVRLEWVSVGLSSLHN